MKTRGVTAKFRPWTPAEDDAIRSRYYEQEAAELADHLGRTEVAIFQRAKRLGMTKNRRWTPDDDQHLTALWGAMSLGHVARTIGRTPQTTYWRARKLGLKCGAVQGMEYISTAAERTGYGTGQLRQILRWAGVKVIRSASRITKSRRHFHVVDSFDVDEAVAQWHQTETVESAAQARGVCGHTLRVWLIQAGLKRGNKKKHWRVKSVAIDHVIAEHAKRQELRSLCEEARRIGVNRWTLNRWLTAAGVTSADPRRWKLDPQVVDRVVAERLAAKRVAA